MERHIGSGISIKLSAQNQLLLNVEKPSRVFIPAWLLREKVAGFRVGRPMLLQASYIEKGARVYHKYAGGSNWVPTAPASVGKPGNVFTLRASPLVKADFLRNYPELKLVNYLNNPSLPNECQIRIDGAGDQVKLLIQQSEPIEGLSNCVLDAEVLGDLVFQTGSVFLNVGFFDAFSMKRTLRLHHNGHKKSFLAVGLGNSWFPVRFISFDGWRLKALYKWTEGVSSATFYMKDPSLLYQVGEASDLPLDSYNIVGVDRLSAIEGVAPVRPLEMRVAATGSYYERGRLGAEIAYTIIQKKLGCKGLVLQEPARKGADIYSKDGTVVAEARLTSLVSPDGLKAQLEKDMMQMIRKVRRELRYSNSIVGYAVLSYPKGGLIRSLVAQVDAPL